MKVFKMSVATFLCAATFAMAQFKQSPLPYAYDALQPYVDAQTMEIHYTKHAAGYVNNLNKAIAGTPMEKESIEQILAHVSSETPAVRNNAGGHYNHELFWTVLTPQKNTVPSAALQQAIMQSFGGVQQLKEALNKAASERFGSGWAWLIVTPEGKLAVTSTPNQDNPLMDVAEIKGTPIFGIDVWEHAYYLKYQNKRADYLSNLWNVVNWNEISRRYESAIKGKAPKWAALDDFHEVMAGTFHPAEKGDLKPLRSRISEMLAKAKTLKSSQVPADCMRPEVQKTVNTLLSQTTALQAKLSRMSDAQAKAKLSELHDNFHRLMEQCGGTEHHH